MASIFACICVARLFGEQSTHRVARTRLLMSVEVHSALEIGFVFIVRLYRTYEIVVVWVAPLLYAEAPTFASTAMDAAWLAVFLTTLEATTVKSSTSAG